MTTKLGSRVTFRIWHPQCFLQYTLPWLVHNWSRPDHTELGFQRRGLHSAPYSRAIKFELLVSLLVESAVSHLERNICLHYGYVCIAL